MAGHGEAGEGWGETEGSTEGVSGAGAGVGRAAGAEPDEPAVEPAGPVKPVWDRAGVLRAARRRADLSQRQLAIRGQVAASTVANAELAGASASLRLVERLLAIMGMRLAVIDADGQEIIPESPDVARDNGGRRFPAHLDAEAMPSVVEPSGRGRQRCRVRYQHRRARDFRREETVFAPLRHPDVEEVAWFSLPMSVRHQRVRGFLAEARMMSVGMLPSVIARMLKDYMRAGPVRPYWLGQLYAVSRPVAYWAGDLWEVAGALKAQGPPPLDTSVFGPVDCRAAAVWGEAGWGRTDARDDDERRGGTQADGEPMFAQDPRTPEELRDERLTRVLAEIDACAAINAMYVAEPEGA